MVLHHLHQTYPISVGQVLVEILLVVDYHHLRRRVEVLVRLEVVRVHHLNHLRRRRRYHLRLCQQERVVRLVRVLILLLEEGREMIIILLVVVMVLVIVRVMLEEVVVVVVGMLLLEGIRDTGVVVVVQDLDP